MHPSRLLPSVTTKFQKKLFSMIKQWLSLPSISAQPHNPQHSLLLCGILRMCRLHWEPDLGKTVLSYFKLLQGSSNTSTGIFSLHSLLPRKGGRPKGFLGIFLQSIDDFKLVLLLSYIFKLLVTLVKYKHDAHILFKSRFTIGD